MLCDFGKVDRDLRRCDADTNTVQDSASDQGTGASDSNLNRGPYKPPQASKHDAVS